MTRFAVDTDELESAAGSLAAMAALCERLLSDVDALAATVSADWTGEANQQFLALQTEWAEGAQLMSAGIQVIHQAAAVSHANYQAGVDAASRIW